MNDLIIAWVIIVLEATVCFLVALRLFKKRSERTISIACTCCVLLLMVYAFVIHGWVGFVRFLPYSSVIVLSNLTLPLLGVLSGVLVRHPKIARWRKGVALLFFVGIAGYAAAQPIAYFPLETGERWHEGVCMQTTDASCSPCCAVTLLASADIEATEQEMVDLCLTNSKGTAMLGLYRGLKLKTEGTDYDVHPIFGDIETLRANEHWPIVLSVGLPRFGEYDPIYVEQWCWAPGDRHAVIMYGFAEDDRVDMGDPSVGQEQWTVDDLELLFRGSAFYLSE
jgi:hypothetical protein